MLFVLSIQKKERNPALFPHGCAEAQLPQQGTAVAADNDVLHAKPQQMVPESCPKQQRKPSSPEAHDLGRTIQFASSLDTCVRRAPIDPAGQMKQPGRAASEYYLPVLRGADRWPLGGAWAQLAARALKMAATPPTLLMRVGGGAVWATGFAVSHRESPCETQKVVFFSQKIS